MDGKTYHRRWRAENPGRNAEHCRRWRLANPGYKPSNNLELKAKKRQWRRANPEKVKAHNALNHSIERGETKRLPCETCGNVRSHAHHEDYLKPLEVTWLCYFHHKQKHTKP